MTPDGPDATLREHDVVDRTSLSATSRSAARLSHTADATVRLQMPSFAAGGSGTPEGGGRRTRKPIRRGSLGRAHLGSSHFCAGGSRQPEPAIQKPGAGGA